MPSTRRKLTTMLAIVWALQCGTALADGSGFRALASDDLWPRWQTRVLASPSFSLWQHAVSTQDAGRRGQESISLLGDFFFSRPLQQNQPAEGCLVKYICAMGGTSQSGLYNLPDVRQSGTLQRCISFQTSTHWLAAYKS